MKRFLAFVAVLSLAHGLSAQVTANDLDTARRAEALANTIQAFENRIPPSALEMDATLIPTKRVPEVNACTTYALPDVGISNGKHLWGVVDQTQPTSHSCYISNDEPWDYWSVPVTPGEVITFALESNVRTYFSIDYSGVFSGISTLQPNGKYLTGYVWTVPSTYTQSTVTFAVSPFATSSIYTLAVAKTVSNASCIVTSKNLCLNAGRFKVEADFVTGTTSGMANASGMTSDTGYFWFFAASNVELLVKIVDGRGVNGKFWVFAGGLTNVDTLIKVTDTQTGVVKTYHNPANTAFQPIQDTNAF
jgi:hypothetical protein